MNQLSRLRVTGDFSHHVVCCERLLDVGEEDKELISQIIPNVSGPCSGVSFYQYSLTTANK